MRRDHLDVLNGRAPVATVVLDTGIRELNVPVLIRQLVLLSPASHSIGPLLRRLTRLAARPVLCLEEPLILALQILFEDYAARVARGEEPDARDYLDRAGTDEPKLAALIEEYLLTMPAVEPSDEQVAALEAWLEGEGPLLGVRRQRGLKRADVVGMLVDVLGLERRQKEKVGEYYHELESGLLDTERVDRRIFDAFLAEVEEKLC